jgi:3-hydroxyacyl-CoA dehydrogenase
MTEIKKVGVLGAGLMGSGIAAHVANAGLQVVLLDIVPDGAENRNVIAEGAVARMIKQKPAPFMDARNAKLITCGNLEDSLDLLADCDWICEAVLERPDIKHDVYKKIDAVRKPGSIVSSNTSTIPLAVLLESQSDAFAADFAITHFFNPPRYMRLLEVVGGEKTRADALETLVKFSDVALGKEVVHCKDTPGFIGNRIGIYWSYTAISQSIDMGLTIEETDALVGKPMGIPSTGIFGLVDLTGIDLAPHVNESMLTLLPETDAFCQDFQATGILAERFEQMIRDGYTGRKGKGGFYRITKEGGKKTKEVLDIKSGEYRLPVKPALKSIRAARKGLRALCEFDDLGGRYSWVLLSKTLTYAASLVGEIADNIDDMDRAMKGGYAWKYGPFEQIDQLGTAWFAEKLEAEGREVPAIIKAAKGQPMYRDNGSIRQQMTLSGEYADVVIDENAWMLEDKKRGAEPIAKNGSASLWDVGDGVACLEFHSKMNSIDGDIVAMIMKAVRLNKDGFKALIIGNDADNFSVGANIGLSLFAANTAMWPIIEQGVKAGQDAYLALKYAPFPVVAAPAGMALGGGCEVTMHCDAVQAHAESYMGLVEVGVGLIPGWGGCKELLMRQTLNKKRPGGPMPAIAATFETISTAKVATSAAEAKNLMFLRKSDGITMNRRRVLADAKAQALTLVDGYEAPERDVEIVLPGKTASLALEMALQGFVDMGKATAYDGVVGGELAGILSGGNTDVTETVTEKDLLALERKAIVKLLHNPKTLNRITHMLETGKPLRN